MVASQKYSSKSELFKHFDKIANNPYSFEVVGNIRDGY